MRKAMMVALVLTGVAGCATLRATGTRSTETMLSAAGFHVAADSAETQRQLASLPPRRITPSTVQGQTSYVYADPDVCQCLYVGTELQYQQYERFRVAQDIEDQRALNTWGYWTPWMSWWW
jgi:hypothetical protein